MFEIVETQTNGTIIKVVGVGGAGGNAITHMITREVAGVEFIAANTDAQVLARSLAKTQIQLGSTGLGAGANPERGKESAQAEEDRIREALTGAHMVFITAGMGGGTGTGAAPIIAKCARERGILTVGVVTKPFHFEGRHRMRLADAGIGELQRYVDTLIVIPNQNLFRVANERTTFAEAFGMADQVLHSGVRSITDLMVLPGLINLDFADVRTVMTEMGKAMMGTGEGTGEDRALMAAQNAIANPLLDEVSLKGAKAVLVNVTGGMDMTLLEVDEAANAISDQVDPEANIIFGAAFDPSLEGVIRVSVVATGMDGASIAQIEPKPVSRNTTTAPLIADTTRAAPASQAEPVRAASRYEARPLDRPSSSYAPEPAYEPEPEIVAEAPQADLYFEEPTVAEAPEPRITQPAPRTVTRIVDPMVEEAEDTPLYTEQHYADRQPQKSGWMSLFGGGRQRDYQQPAPQQPQARSTTSARPAMQPLEAQQVDEGEDLEIPSFLRRLAN
jgi:cell division protein FtsZ